MTEFWLLGQYAEACGQAVRDYRGGMSGVCQGRPVVGVTWRGHEGIHSMPVCDFHARESFAARIIDGRAYQTAA